MKTIIALTTYAIASIAEKILKPRIELVAPQLTTQSELTDEIRRYDTGDLLLS
jgi:hypothetical protein